jgi:hypothetical protein
VANARDVTLDIIGHDKTRAATQSAAGNLETLKRKMDAAGQSSKSFGQKFKAGVSAAAPYAQAAGLALAGLGIASVKAASAAEQSIGATQTVFGAYADTVVARSKEAAAAYGLSANEYRENATLIGSLFRNQGVAADKLAGQTDNMISLAADLAATFGTSTKEAVEALGSAFKGEFDPMEKFGVSLRQSTIDAYLAANGQDKLTGKAKVAAQQAAIQALITKQAGGAVGAFGRESDTTAGKQAILAAKTKDLAAQFGENLLPYVNRALEALLAFGAWAKEHPAIIKAVAVGIAALTLGILAMNLAFLASPFGMVVVAIAAIAAVVAYCWQKFETFREVVKAVGKAIVNIFQGWLNVWLTVVGGIVTAAAKAFGWVPGIGGKLKAAAEKFNEFRDDVNNALDGIKDEDVNVNIRAKIATGGLTPDQKRQLTGRGVPINSAGSTFALLDNPGGSRTGGPLTVQSGPTTVHTTVIIDGREVRAVARTEVEDRASRDAWRIRTGRR